MKTALLATLAIFAAGHLFLLIRAARSAGSKERMPNLVDCGIGLLVSFLDSLGIGAFAPTTAIFRLLRLVRDEQMPGTLNAGLSIPGILEAALYIEVVKADVTTMTAMIAAAALGAWLGAAVVSRWPRRKIQLGMGIALLTTATFGLMTQLHLFPGGGDRIGLAGPKLVLAVAVSAVLGALKAIGIGFYAPCMIVIYLLGMNPKAAYPIMMGAIAFAGPVASAPFIREGCYNLRSALGLTLGGIPAVLVAAFIVRSLPLVAVRWLVLVIVVYTAIMMLRSAVSASQQAQPATRKIADLSNAS
jgi:uncharacterized membrane protein YfcA